MKLFRYIFCLLLVTQLLKAEDSFTKGKIELSGDKPSLEILAKHMHPSYDMRVSFSPPQSENFLRGFKVADKLFNIGLLSFLHRDGEKHPFPKLSEVKSIPLSSQKSKSLDEEISGFNLYMRSKALEKLDLIKKPAEAEKIALMQEDDEAREKQIPQAEQGGVHQSTTRSESKSE